MVDEAHFDDMFNTNIKGAFFTIQKLLPVLKDGSSIVLNGSCVANAGYAAGSVYTATKAALNSLAKTLSKDLLPRRIRVNTVNPGPVMTPIFDKLGLPEDAKAAMQDSFIATVPVGRFGDVREITGYVAFLLSDQSTFVLGTELTIDGGATQL
jgi:NAD(P)-dependent dehydrogenase (short-subunit alcohol dehydrogenase family)